MPTTTPANMRRLAVCLDGTWNTMESMTNVSRIFKAIADGLSGCSDQAKYYEEGVGTKWGEKIRGGVVGLGLDENIIRSYCWLVNNYKTEGATASDVNDSSGEKFSVGDEVFIFGFSRGAFTARSLAGLINRVGILNRARLAKEHADEADALVKQAWSLYRTKYEGDPDQEVRDQDPWKSFRLQYCHTAKIKFVGVWDTVGALGVPLLRGAIPFIPAPRGGVEFHDTSLGRVVENAFHAMAIDEHRNDYQVTLWSRKHPVGTQQIEQRWFAGAHANVGGGYDDDLLPDIPLLWMAKNAVQCGLEFTADAKTALELRKECVEAPPAEFALDGTEFMSSVRDSYREFLLGLYGLVRRRCYRRMLVPSDGVNQTVDNSVRQKWNADADYRPLNLAKAGRVDAGTVMPAGINQPT